MQYTYGRRTLVYVGINNKDVSGDIRRFITSFSFEENADGKSDEMTARDTAERIIRAKCDTPAGWIAMLDTVPWFAEFVCKIGE